LGPSDAPALADRLNNMIEPLVAMPYRPAALAPQL
jgi:hypothetical protein